MGDTDTGSYLVPAWEGPWGFHDSFLGTRRPFPRGSGWREGMVGALGFVWRLGR